MRLLKRSGLIVVGLAVAAGLAACGGQDSGGGNAAPAATDYASCLRANGVTLPSGRPDGFPSGRPRPSGSGGPGELPPPGQSGGPGARPSGGPGGGGPGGGMFGSGAPDGVDQQAWEKAQQACANLRPSGGPGGGNPNGALTAYRNCLSDHGVTLSGGPDSLDTTDPKVAEAVKACEPLLPTAGATPSPSSS